MEIMKSYAINPEVLKIYRDYTYERASVYHKKEILQESAPWTEHPYLQKYKFTNVNRRLDRESKFLIQSVCEHPNLSFEDKVLNCALYRMINCKTGCQYFLEWPIRFTKIYETLNKATDDLIDEYFDLWKEFEFKFELTDVAGNKQSNAYFLSLVRKVCYESNKKLRGYNVALMKYVYDNYATIVEASRLQPKEAIEKLQSIKGYGDFMAYQIWVDWTYIPGYHATDDDYVVSGPGCDQGIDWMTNNCKIVGREGKSPEVQYNLRNWKKEDYNEFIIWFRDNLPSLMEEYKLEWDPKQFLHFMPESLQHWGLQEVENGWCELNKLMKLRNGCKMRTRSYDGEGGNL